MVPSSQVPTMKQKMRLENFPEAGEKRQRGRPPGSKKKDSIIRTHVLEILAGGNVADAITAFARNVKGGVCVLSVTGPVSSAVFRQPSGFPGTASFTFRNCYNIVSMSASFLEEGEGSISVLMSGPQGEVIGGAVAGPVVAAGKVIVVVIAFSNPTVYRFSNEDGLGWKWNSLVDGDGSSDGNGGNIGNIGSDGHEERAKDYDWARCWSVEEEDEVQRFCSLNATVDGKPEPDGVAAVHDLGFELPSEPDIYSFFI